MSVLSSILDEIKKIKSTKKELREFGIVMGCFFGLLTGLLIWRHRPFLWMGGLSVFFFVFGFFLPNLLKPLQKAWMTFAVLMGFVMSRVILSILFFLVLSPLALISRLTGKKYLDLTFRKPEPTYWNPVQTKNEKEYYEHQY